MTGLGLELTPADSDLKSWLDKYGFDVPQTGKVIISLYPQHTDAN